MFCGSKEPQKLHTWLVDERNQANVCHFEKQTISNWKKWSYYISIPDTEDFWLRWQSLLSLFSYHALICTCFAWFCKYSFKSILLLFVIFFLISRLKFSNLLVINKKKQRLLLNVSYWWSKKCKYLTENQRPNQ